MEIVTHKTRTSPLRFLLACVATATLLAGCAANPGDSVAKQGAKSGAAIGAGIGLLMGVLSGDPEKAIAGAAVGAGLGAGQGAYEGWRQDQDDFRTRQITEAIRQSNQGGSEDRQREELTRFLGVWQMTGWMEEPGSDRVHVQAQVNGNVQMRYFVELAWIDLKVNDSEARVWGTTTLGYDDNSGYEMSTRFNTLPDSLDLSGGAFDSSKRTFTWQDPEGVTSIRFETPDLCIIETRVGGKLLESYRLTRS